MRVAIGEAAGAAMLGDVPIGAVIVHEGRIIARGHNRREADRDPTAHAELLALRQAARHLGGWRLTGCTVYVTLEPCSHHGKTPPCADAIVAAGIARVVSALEDPNPEVAGQGHARLRAAVWQSTFTCDLAAYRAALFDRLADVPTLITGPSGTGKELVARAIHEHSPRRDRPFLPVHVAALNPNLVESELFGHVKGAFTGAAQARAGLLALANGGTVFLDELADIPLPVQVKLLRVLEHDEVLPVGGTQQQPLDIRILAATHQDLARRVGEGAFRHDLFFRLNVFQIHLPPLRERPEDLVLLAEHFLRRFEPRALPLLPETVRHLQSLPWFGNVRELRNALEHAAIVARGGPLLPEHFPTLGAGFAPADRAARLATAVKQWLEDRVRAADGPAPADLYAELLRCVEPALLEDVMRRVQDNRWVAARWLGLNRATVRKKLNLYGLSQPAKDDDEEPPE